MKTFILFLACLYIYNINAQTCNSYISTKAGTSLEYIHYNAKGKVESSHKTIINDVENNNDELIIKTTNIYYDNKSNETYKTDNDYFCKNGVFYINMNNLFDGQTMSAYQNMEISLQADNMELPSTMTAGQKLNDGSATMGISNQGIKIATITVNITNRSVDAFESITTPAGTFDCYKISYDSETKLLFKVKAKTTEWYAPNIGLIKSETFDGKGKATGSTILNSFS